MAVKKNRFKYIKMALTYSNNKFWYLLLVSVVPAILISFIVSPYSSLRFLRTYGSQDMSDFSTIFLTITGFRRESWLSIFGFVLIPMAFSVLMGAVERHMRIGEFSLGFNRVGARLNFNYKTSLIFSLVLLTIFAIDKFVQASVFLLVAKLFSHTAAFTLSIIWYILMVILEVFVLSLITLWVPTMLHTGLSSPKAFALSVRQIKDHLFQVMLALFVPLLPIGIVMTLLSVFGAFLAPFFDAPLIAIILVYYVIMMYTVYFDVNGIEREDLNKVNIWKMKSY